MDGATSATDSGCRRILFSARPNPPSGTSGFDKNFGTSGILLSTTGSCRRKTPSAPPLGPPVKDENGNLGSFGKSFGMPLMDDFSLSDLSIFSSKLAD